MSNTATKFVLLASLALLVSCGKKVDTEPDVPAVVAEPIGPNVEEALAAMLRGHPNSKKICVDGLREKAFFLDYGPLPVEAADRHLFSGGWLFIEKVEFYKTSNNTWFITNQDEKKYTPVYPDIAGLNCKVK